MFRFRIVLYEQRPYYGMYQLLAHPYQILQDRHREPINCYLQILLQLEKPFLSSNAKRGNFVDVVFDADASIFFLTICRTKTFLSKSVRTAFVRKQCRRFVRPFQSMIFLGPNLSLLSLLGIFVNFASFIEMHLLEGPDLGHSISMMES